MASDVILLSFLGLSKNAFANHYTLFEELLNEAPNINAQLAIDIQQSQDSLRIQGWVTTIGTHSTYAGNKLQIAKLLSEAFQRFKR